MRKDLAKWLLNAHMNLKVALALSAGWALLLILIGSLAPMRSVEARLISPALFQVREAMNRSPKISPRIKVFAIDDVTFSYLQGPTLNLQQWADVLHAIDEKNPRAIIIDALFSGQRMGPGDGEAARRELQAVATPIYTGSFPTPTKIYGRTPLELDALTYKLSSYTDEEQSVVANFRSSLIYGPGEGLEGIFHRNGHILYGENEGVFYPFLGLKKGRVLPHLMLLPFSDTKIAGNEVYADGARFRVARDGSVPINFAPRAAYDKVVKPLIHLLNPEWANQALDAIEEGDYVYIIPMFYTGNTDFKPSPIGLIPGAYSHLAVLSSIIEQDTIAFLEWEGLAIIVFSGLVFFFAWLLRSLPYLVSLMLMTGTWVVACFTAFTYLGLILPMLLPLLAILCVGVTLLIEKMVMADRRARMIRHTLDGFLEPNALATLQKNPQSLAYSLDARERVLTVVFIDIVGFSLMVENQMPRAAFEGLQAVIKGISEIVHKHGGVVNKTLGDGLLCFFGYSIDEHKEIQNHAENALRAAFDIQKLNVSRILSAEQVRKPVFPLRIGINTGPIFMGNLGTGQRVDITVVGTGVNFAKRLESACQAHLVLIGRTTHAIIDKTRSFGPSEKKWIAIKHHDEAVESWEYNPFHDVPNLREKAEDAFEGTALSRRVLKENESKS